MLDETFPELSPDDITKNITCYIAKTVV